MKLDKSLPIEQVENISSRWTKLDSERSTPLNRARDCAELTIPSILPRENHSEDEEFHTPCQSLGARAVNNLAAKLLLALLPPNAPFFRFVVDQKILDELSLQDKQELEKSLSRIERGAMSEIEKAAMRVPIFLAIKYLIVTGNALLFAPDEGGLKCYRFDQYVVKRNGMGKVIEVITKETVHPMSLPVTVRMKITGKDAEKVDVFTRAFLNTNKQWEFEQQVEDITIPGSQGTYPEDENPFIPLRWSAITGENYGRGLVEEYLGDLRSLEALSQAIVEGSAAAARVLFLVNPNGTTRAKTLDEAPNGAIREGNAQDVSCLQMEKFNDFRIALDTIGKIEQRIAQAFLLVSSVQRDAERVTAEEIRTMANELEGALGGVYSVLSLEMQTPLVKRIFTQMRKKKNMPQLPKDVVIPVITTGLESLGRGNDLNKLKMFLQGLAEVFPPEKLFSKLNMDEVIARYGTSLGIDTNGLILSGEEVDAATSQGMTQNVLAQATPGAIQEVVKGVMQNGIDPSILASAAGASLQAPAGNPNQG